MQYLVDLTGWSGGVVVSSPGVWGDKYLDDGRWKDFPGIVGGGRLLVGIL